MDARTTLHSDLSHRSSNASDRSILPSATVAQPPPHPRQRVASTVSNASDAPSLTQQEPQRLSCMSCSTKNALALNQLQHVEILTSYKRSEDGVTMYVLDVSLNPYQTGIPNVCMSAEFIDGRFQNRDTTASIISSTSPRSIVPQPPPTAQFSQSDASNATERNNKIKSKHASAHANKSQPHYQLEYRFSAFRELRTRLRDAVEESDRHHLKWCWYCSKIQWVATFGGFPSRHPLLKFLTKHSRCGESLERVLLDKVICRRQRLALFVNEVVASAKNASYRYQSAQCGCYAKVAVIVTDFLAEPHMRACIGDSNGGTAW